MSSPCFNKKKGVAGIAFCGGPIADQGFCTLYLWKTEEERGKKKEGRGSSASRSGRGQEGEKKKGKGLSYCGLGPLFEQMNMAKVSLRVSLIFASCMYATWCKTTSAMGNMHNYRYRFLRGVYRYKVFGALTKRVLPTLVRPKDLTVPSCTLCACMHIPIYPYIYIYIYVHIII